ncbi:MAG TPA: aminotransferase class I/II-fold pyridoxal phosphate-dependent enzyme, partial [Pseudorhodoferax sp.]|nr:aminotransferase class I/II-fold pyridoxal phosphate-dependent enzyme [Pseudorhodoferax sp.]
MDIETISLAEPDVTAREDDLIGAVLRSAHWADGPMLDAFERAFAGWCGRAHAVAVASGTLGTWIALRALGIGPGDEVVCAAHTWHQVAQAITLAGATPVFADIDYWSGCLSVDKAAPKIGPRTRAILAGNTNGHPAAWRPLRALADAHGLRLIEDSTEALGSRYLGQPVGGFGDVSVFDFSPPSPLCTGEGGMLVTDDELLAHELRYLRQRRLSDRASLSVGSWVPLQAGMSSITAALGLAQLAGLDERLARRKQVEAWYHEQMQSFEGIKPPYLADDVDEVHWMLYVVHLGKRFTASARAATPGELALGWAHSARFYTTAAKIEQLPFNELPEIAFVGR